MLTKNKKKGNNLLVKPSFFLSLAVVALAAFLIFTNWRIMQRRMELSEKLESLKSEVENLQDYNDELEQGMAESQTEEYLERIARENLDFKQPGEDVVVVKSSVSTSTEEEKIEEKSFWQKILEMLGY
jgi:cell division protein FtsB